MNLELGGHCGITSEERMELDPQCDCTMEVGRDREGPRR